MSLAISSIKELERTLFVFASPVLAFEAFSFIHSLPPSSFLLFLEGDAQLGELFEKQFFNNFKQQASSKKNIDYICTNDINTALDYIEQTTNFSFKRLQLVRCSGGFNFYEQFYIDVIKRTEDAIGIFWKNRITLIEMGRLYSRNIFKWMVHIAKEKKNIENSRFKLCKKNSISLPIIVCGAGPSLKESYEFILNNRTHIFVLAVDVALPALKEAGIEPDGVVLLEGQYWIEKAFFSSSSKKIDLFASITANPHIYNILSGDIFLYATEFAKSPFLEKIKSFCPDIPFFAPLGSVGLQAIQIANFIAKDYVPIFHIGLDFAYYKGFTHATSSMPAQNLLISNDRFNGLYRGENIFPMKCEWLIGKNEEKICTTPMLLTYANLYKQHFSNTKNIFDISSSGLVLRDSFLTFKELQQILDSFICKNKNILPKKEALNPQNIAELFLKEQQNLHKIKNALIGRDKIAPNYMLELLKQMDYLYLHFPDYPFLGDKEMLSLSFLKRVRIEVEYFLKLNI